MKLRYILCSALFSLSGFVQAAEPLCLQKEQAIQHEIDMARKHDNQRRITGLERALTEARAGCTDAKLKSEHQEKIKQHQQEITQREHDLKEARDKGDSDKITKREKKLAEAREELKSTEAAPY
ncbi:vacuolar-type H+-ATPase subunit I/STV1 [Erwinia toletana]|uniref:Vacuolar-type H+-ATPase subunit I/STV1 n=1 Tax=Winslowiella toletana TaxID=92490 RepID=A0ABS4P6X2_9GAMM|nr:DUF1090 domain-containing protein [Winslowiella toletana]MBP2168391.1 vacuolar-type H+-ATPase subunit I/STV1 [Winslowiella toletana]